MYQIILGLSALNDEGIVHRDIKPENIYINKNVYKIGQFHFAEITDIFSTKLGTPLYMAPEFYDNQVKTNKVDVWACGCMLHQLLFGTLAFNAKDLIELEDVIKKGNYKPTSELEPEIEDLLMGMLNKNVALRYSFEELKNHRAFDFISTSSAMEAY